MVDFVQTTINSPRGALILIAHRTALVGLYFENQIRPSACETVRNHPVLDQVAIELEEYFYGSRTLFSIPINTIGTAFERRVWCALSSIPFGETRSYGEIARQLNSPNASRAVGHANSKNPISIVVPCHRVIGAAGCLTGYAGGLDKKRWLLDHERSRATRRGRVSVGHQPTL